MFRALLLLFVVLAGCRPEPTPSDKLDPSKLPAPAAALATRAMAAPEASALETLGCTQALVFTKRDHVAFATALGLPPRGEPPTAIDVAVECRAVRAVRCDDVARRFMETTRMTFSSFDVVSGPPSARHAFARCYGVYDDRGRRIRGEGD